MKVHQLLSSILVKSFLVALFLTTSALARDGKIVKLVGSGAATVKLPNGTTQAATQGMVIPEKSTITTAGVEVFLETAQGALAAIKPNSTVEVSMLGQKGAVADTELFLQSGSVVSTIDPKKKEVNDYKVRTQRGVAAAKATVYSVTVTQTGTSVATLSGIVTLTPTTPGAPVITINLGTGTVLTDAPGATAVPLSQIAAQNPQVATAIAEAVTTVANAIQTNSVSGLSSDGATSVLTSVVNAASQALPQSAATFTQQAVNAATSPGSAVGAGGVNAVTSISQAAAQGATQTLTQQGNSAGAQQVNQQIAQMATSTASSNNVAVTNQAIVNSVQFGANTGASNAGGPPPAPPSLPGVTAPTGGAGGNAISTTPPINVDARPVSPSSSSTR